ncbi:fimbrial protein [Kluyvera sp. CHPC 1.251]|uniref:fimbrial protein n=1 Tax=Kluyvera sp. CHPC 1.251 TaxID=2995175 RepID=UPI002FD81371
MVVTISRYLIWVAHAMRYFLLGCLLFSGPTVWAYDTGSSVTFNVTGTIKEPSCNVAITPSSSIELGTVASQHMSAPGATGRNVPIGLELSSCSTNLTSFILTFDGQPYDATYNMIYKNLQEGDSAADGVGLQIFSVYGVASLGPGEWQKYAFTDTSGEMTLYLIARMYSPYGIVRAGKVKFSATFTIVYN